MICMGVVGYRLWRDGLWNEHRVYLRPAAERNAQKASPHPTGSPSLPRLKQSRLLDLPGAVTENILHTEGIPAEAIHDLVSDKPGTDKHQDNTANGK